MSAIRRVISALTAATAGSAVTVAAASAAASGSAGAASAAVHVRPALAPGVISVLAGGPGGPGRATRVALSNVNVGSRDCGLAYGAGGLYVADGSSVRAVSPGDDRLTTPAGTSSPGPLGNMGSATRADLLGACGVALDHSGNLVIADGDHNEVRAVAAIAGTFYGQAMKAGRIYRIAGFSRGGYSGDGGPALQAKLDRPFGVTVDGAGNVVIGDSFNNRVRVAAASTGTFYGQAMTAGDIYTVAGDGTAGYSGDGGPATSAELNSPNGAVTDGAGNLVVSDGGNFRVRVVAAATGTFYGRAMTAGDIYTVAGNGKNGFSGDRGPATAAVMDQPSGISLDLAGNMIIADSINNRIRVAAASTGTFYGQAMTAGDVYTVAGNGRQGNAGDGGPATAASLDEPGAVTVDGSGNLVIATTTPTIRVVAERTGTFYGQAMTAGDIYTIAGSPTVGHSSGIAVDQAGNVVISDGFLDVVQVLAGSTGTFYGQAMTAGHVYTVAGTGTQAYNGDGIPALQADLRIPDGIAVDAAGNLVVSDADNQRVRVVAEHTGTFYGQAMTAGDIYTVAGCGDACGSLASGIPATTAQLFNPGVLTVDGPGNLVFGDNGDGFRLRVVAEHTGTFYGQAMTAGDIYTIGGAGKAFPANGVPAVKAEFAGFGLAVTAAGNLQVSDLPANRILEIGG